MLPLAIYFYFLANLNQRRNPTLLAGTWDFASVLLGLLGFLTLGSLLVLSLFDSLWRAVLFGGNFGRIQAAWSAGPWISVAILGVYLLVVCLLVPRMLLRRRKVTEIYNVDPRLVEELLFKACETLGLRSRKVLGGIEFEASQEEGLSSIGWHHEVAMVQVVQFPVLCHATLRWKADGGPVRMEIERTLGTLLAERPPVPNASAGWFTTAAVTSLLVCMAWIGFLLFLRFKSR